VIDIEQTWDEVVKSMGTLENDIKKNSKSRTSNQAMNILNNQQPVNIPNNQQPVNIPNNQQPMDNQ
jgi:hypothetical protein